MGCIAPDFWGGPGTGRLALFVLVVAEVVMRRKLKQMLLGPRIPESELRHNPLRYRAPTLILSLARLSLLVSLFLPYWQMELGLTVTAYINRLTGDIAEIDGLNHYIGMRPLEEAAQLERSLSVAMLITLILIVEGAVYVRTKWAAVLALPAVLFPFFFLLDLFLWMNHFGQNLDPTAPLSNAIKPFTPPILGEGNIGQFRTVASAGSGLILAFITSALVVIGMFFHRRAFKPLVDAMEHMPSNADAPGDTPDKAGEQ